jgi:hypothetical protein
MSNFSPPKPPGESSMPPLAIKIALIVFHVIQYLVTASAGFSLASIIAAVMVGAQLLPKEHFTRTFKLAPIRVSQFGSLLWFLVAFAEMRMAG